MNVYIGLGGYEILLILFSVIPFILWIWVLIDLLKSHFKDSTIKVLWLLVVIFLPFIGALLYLIIGRGQRV